MWHSVFHRGRKQGQTASKEAKLPWHEFNFQLVSLFITGAAISQYSLGTFGTGGFRWDGVELANATDDDPSVWMADKDNDMTEVLQIRDADWGGTFWSCATNAAMATSYYKWADFLDIALKFDWLYQLYFVEKQQPVDEFFRLEFLLDYLSISPFMGWFMAMPCKLVPSFGFLRFGRLIRFLRLTRVRLDDRGSR